MKREVAELIKVENLREYLTEKGRKIVAEADKNWQAQNQVLVANAEEDKVININVGGSEICGLTSSTAKRKLRDVCNVCSFRNGPSQSECSITFTE